MQHLRCRGGAVETACQTCGRRLLVAVTFDGPALQEPGDRCRRPTYGDIRSFHYGDPPSHGAQGCLAGNRSTLRPSMLVDFWEREAANGAYARSMRSTSVNPAERRKRQLRRSARLSASPPIEASTRSGCRTRRRFTRSETEPACLGLRRQPAPLDAGGDGVPDVPGVARPTRAHDARRTGRFPQLVDSRSSPNQELS
jgi:hypothetical protein